MTAAIPLASLELTGGMLTNFGFHKLTFKGYMYLADHGSADHMFQRILALPAPSGMIPSHLVVLFASSEGFIK